MSEKNKYSREHYYDKRQTQHRRSSLGINILLGIVVLLGSVLLAISSFLLGRNVNTKNQIEPQQYPTQLVEMETAAPTETTMAETLPPPTESEQDQMYREISDQCLLLSEEGRYAEALQYLQRMVQNNPSDERLSALMVTYEGLYYDNVIGDAYNLSENGDLRLAVTNLIEAQNVLPNADFQSLIVKYKQKFAQNQLSASRFHTGIINSNGTASVYGTEYYGQSDVMYWHDLASISLGDRHAVGLKRDGSVVTAGSNDSKQLSGVASWSEVAVISAGDVHTAALLKNGTVVATGHYVWNYDITKLYSSSPIISIASGYLHTVALHEDGTVTAIGSNEYGQCDVSNWRDIIAVYAGTEHTLGLRLDGSVVACGNNADGRCNVQNWRNMRALAAGDYFSLGVCSDGSVLCIGDDKGGGWNVSSWNNIIDIAGGHNHSVGQMSSGRYIATGVNEYGECDIQ